jgi:hypothetical protein
MIRFDTPYSLLCYTDLHYSMLWVLFSKHWWCDELKWRSSGVTVAWRRMKSGGEVPHIVDAYTVWMWVVTFTFRPYFPGRKGNRVPLNRRLAAPHSRSRSLLLLEWNPNRLLCYPTIYWAIPAHRKLYKNLLTPNSVMQNCSLHGSM